MAEFIQGSQLRTLLTGRQVVRPASLQPASTTGTLFTVSGGAVLITSLFGLVATATPATVNTLAIGTAPTVGTANTAGIATAVSTASHEAGSWITVQPASGVAGALVVGTNAGAAVWDTGDFVVPAGTITWTTTGTAATGTIAWYLSYVPLDTGASVA